VGLIPFALSDFTDDGGAAVREFLAEMETDIREKSVVWVATRREDRTLYKRDGVTAYLNEDGEPLTVGVYHIQGVFTEEGHAVAACRDASYMVGALPLNYSLPHAAVEWLGAYFPLAVKPAAVPFWKVYEQAATV
jgi:hypothetical protein